MLGMVDSCFVWAEKMISDNPQNAWGYYHLASAWYCIDSIPKAQEYYLKAKEMDSYLINNLYRLAHTYRIQGLHKEAIKILEKILEINNEAVAPYYEIGINYQAEGNQDEAQKYFSRFKNIANDLWIKQWPELPATYTSLAAVNARLNEMDSSRIMLEKAITIDSTKHFEFATVLSIQGNIPGAVEHIEKALENGYRNLIWLKMNPDLQILQYDIRFRQLLDKYF